MTGPISIIAQGGGGNADWMITVIFAVIAAIVSLVGWLAKRQGQQQQPPAGRRQPPGRRQLQGAAPAAQGNQGNPRDEVEEFLRRVAERRTVAKPPDVEVLDPEPPRRPPIRPAPVPAEEVVEAAEVEVVGESFPGGSVSQHVDSHMGRSDPQARRRLIDPKRTRAAHLSDDAMEEHIHDVFDHDVGSLETTGSSLFQDGDSAGGGAQSGAPGARLPATAAAGLGALLADTGSLRRAIVINEILKRPDFDF